MTSDWYYLYLRTKTAMEYADAALPALELEEIENDYGAIKQLDFGDGEAWQDGTVLRIPALGDFSKLATRLKNALSAVEAWGIHDSEQRFAEHLGVGPLGGFFLAHKRKPISQIYLKYEREAPKPQSWVDQLRQHLEPHAACRPVFHLRNGIILLAASDEPPKVIFGRCQRFVRGLPGFLFIEPSGNTFNVSGRVDEVWQDFFEPLRPEYEPEGV